MKALRFIAAFLLATLIAGLTACGDAHFRKGRSALGRGDYPRALSELSQAALKSPRDYRRFRELGVALFQTRQLDQAVAALGRARKLQPNDGRTLFFLGMCHEQKGNFAEAITVYGEYRKRSFFDPMNQQLQARISRLSLKLAELEVQQALQLEKTRTPAPVRAHTVAVLYFRNVSERREWNTLLKGLTSILITDLGKVRSLRLVERAKLEVLMQEIELSSSGLYDQLTAPRAGRILGAERVIIGGATGLGTSNLQLDAGVIQSATSATVSKPVRVTGRLSEILQLEKELAFSLIDQLGVRLSESERETIQKLPTESTLAFVAFCRGLEFADSLKIPQAQQSFSEAVRLDPNFEAAREELNTLTTPVVSSERFIALQAQDVTPASAEQHLDVTAAALQNPDAVPTPLIPPIQTGTVRVTGKLR
ncbi:MAG: tetratricopeptide repeat protein [bacterium]